MIDFNDRSICDDNGMVITYHNNYQIDSKDADVNMIIGRRANGKSYGTLTVDCIKEFIDSNYEKQFAYVRRWDTEMSIIQNDIFNGMVQNGWLEWYSKGAWNDVQYWRNKWYLRRLNADREVEDKCTTPMAYGFCVNTAEKAKGPDYPHIKTIVFDEFMDSSRATTRQMVELQNNISTFGRLRDSCHVLMLGNTVDRYCFWFEEFCIENDIVNLTFGSYIEKKTALGTSFICELMRVSDSHKEKIVKNKIRFSGFETPKMNAFNGLQEWQGSAHEHIPDNDLLKNKPIIDNLWIHHRNAYIRIKVYNDTEFGYFIFMHYSNKPKFDDSIILSLKPESNNEFYGFAEYAPIKLKRTMQKIVEIIGSRKIYFSTNSVGELFSNYYSEYKTNKRSLL